MFKRIILLFPLMVFLLIREIYANLFRINKDYLTALLLSGLAVLAVVSFQARMREKRRDFLVLDIINLLQFVCAAVVITLFYLSGGINDSQAVYSVYSYCFAPFLIYAAFLVYRLKPVTQRVALIALGCAYALTVLVAVCESLGIDYWLFHYERWILQANYLDIFRASGLYGTHIDYGLLSFLAFTVAFYSRPAKGRWFASVVMVLAVLAALLTMSRAWVGAIGLVVLVHTMMAQSFKRKVQIGVLVLVVGAGFYTIADQLGFVTMLEAADVYTQDSNQARVEFLQQTPKWLREYMIVGTGPGTQNGPDPGEHTKFVGDFLWLSTMVECGTLFGGALNLARIVLIALVLWRTARSDRHGGLRAIAIVVALSFLLAAFINGAYAHYINVAIFYVICGLALVAEPGQIAADRRSTEPAANNPITGARTSLATSG
ncbi:MAG: O-antigen ligase family protein [Terriglobales bacterium]